MRKLPIFVFLCLLLVAPLVRADEAKKDAAIEPTHWGRVTGQVYDARTGAPLADALVTIRTDGVFPEKGRSVGKSDALGRYSADAMLGRVSSNLDVGRLLNTGIFGLLAGGATNKTKRIDVSQLTLRIARDGYAPFEGVVHSRSVDPGKFTVTLEPVLLVPAGSAEVSTAADRWGVVRLESLTVEPAILAPGEKATVVARVSCPPLAKDPGIKVSFVSDFSRRADLKLRPGAPDGRLDFAGTLTAPRDKRARSATLRAAIRESPLDVADSAREKTTLVQVVTTDAERQAAVIRADAFALQQSGENVAAAARWKKLAQAPEATVFDLERLAEVSALLHDDAAVVAARRRAWELTPEKERIARAAPLALALTESGDADQAIREFAPLVETVKERDRPRRIPSSLMLALGTAYLREGNLEQAAKVADSLQKWPESVASEAGYVEFRNSLRLAQARARAAEEPQSATVRADLARVLMDQGRWEEAVDELRVAAGKEGASPAVHRDLAYARLRLRGKSPAETKDLDAAIAEAKRQVEFTDGKKVLKSKDFFAWHSLGMLLYTKASRQAPEEAAATLAESRLAFSEALKSARTGAAINNGSYSFFFGYTSPRVVGIAGFAYPEANADFILLESLKRLEKDPGDYLANFSLGTALLDLGEADLAAAPIKRAREARPDFVEARFAESLVALQQGRRADAVAGLRAVVRENPRHSRAHLVLARLYEEDGDTPSAAASLADHARYYGTAARQDP